MRVRTASQEQMRLTSAMTMFFRDLESPGASEAYALLPVKSVDLVSKDNRGRSLLLVARHGHTGIV